GVLSDAERLVRLQHQLLHGLVVHVDVVAAAEVLQEPTALLGGLQLGVAARDAGVWQADVAGGFAADQQAGPVQVHAPATPRTIDDFEVIHGNAPKGGVDGNHSGKSQIR